MQLFTFLFFSKMQLEKSINNIRLCNILGKWHIGGKNLFVFNLEQNNATRKL